MCKAFPVHRYIPIWNQVAKSKEDIPQKSFDKLNTLVTRKYRLLYLIITNKLMDLTSCLLMGLSITRCLCVFSTIVQVLQYRVIVFPAMVKQQLMNENVETCAKYFSANPQQRRMLENVETCAKYFSRLITLAAGQSEATAGNVRDLIQTLVVSTYRAC